MLARAKSEGNPIIDGETVTLLWEGDDPPRLAGDFNHWGQVHYPVELTEQSPGAWAYSFRLPSDVYIEYNFMRDDVHLGDPLNPNRVDSGVGHMQHYFAMPEYVADPIASSQTSIKQGRLTTLTLRAKPLAVSGRRKIHLYSPPTEAPCPLLVVFDGNDYLARGRLVNIVDNLIAESRIQPIAMALIENHPRERMIEYACNELTLALVIGPVLESAAATLNLLDIEEHPGSYGVMGASMGGLMALYTGLRAPTIFGNVISQSGAFSLFDHDTVIYNLIDYSPVRPVKVWMDIGRLDFPDLCRANPRVYDLLLDRGYPVTFREYPGGHNYTSWRNDVWRGLETLFPPDSLAANR